MTTEVKHAQNCQRYGYLQCTCDANAIALAKENERLRDIISRMRDWVEPGSVADSILDEAVTDEAGDSLAAWQQK